MTALSITAHSAGDIAVALGIAQQSMGMGKVGYVKMLGAAAPDEAAIAAIAVQSAEVHLAFEADLAARLTGCSAPDERKAVLVGAGAIGSHVADALAREGRFHWTVIDNDRLLPHNLARHIARGDAVTRPKAKILADHINLTLAGSSRAHPIPANLFTDGEQGVAVEGALRGADIIIDATASVVAARHLSDHEALGRRASLFFNPGGDAAVLLAEPAGRTLTLRDLEAQYLGLVLRTDGLADHLGRQAETIAYTGACRAITNRIPQSRAAVLSGLAASGLAAIVDSESAAIRIWSITDDGGVRVDTAPPKPVTRFRAGDWEIAFDAGLVRRLHEMRDARVPSETGGVLFGLVDIPSKRIHLVDASAAPSDSDEQRGSFVRGVSGVDELMESVRQRTAGQVRYIGEWHSHPPRSSARPSTVDGRQIDWLAALMGMDSIPALMRRRAGARRRYCEPARRALAAVPRRRLRGSADDGPQNRACTLRRRITRHLGCLRALHDLGILDRVQVLSTVSGGSVIGALYAASDEPFPAFEARVRVMLASGLVRPSIRTAFLTAEGAKALLCAALVGTANLLFVALTWLLWFCWLLLPARVRPRWQTESWHLPFRRFASRTTILRRAIDNELFKGKRLRDLQGRRPLLVINAAELRTGSAFYFTANESGSWRLGRLASPDVTLAHAVTASAAYQMFLPALNEELPFDKRDGARRSERVTLTDGGVYDNLGLAPLWPDRDPSISLNVKPVDTIICCRGGYGLRHDPPSHFMIARLKSAIACIHDRAQNATMKRLFELRDVGKLRTVILPYLGQDDSRLKHRPDHLVTREEAYAYPTDFFAMSEEWIDRLSRRGEQLTRALIEEHAPELAGLSAPAAPAAAPAA